MAPFAGSKRRSVQVVGVSAFVAMALLACGCSSRSTPDASQSPSAGLAQGLDVDPNSALGDALEQGEFLVEKQFTAADIRGMTLAPGVTATGRDRARGRKGRRRRLSGAVAGSRVGDSSAAGG